MSRTTGPLRAALRLARSCLVAASAGGACVPASEALPPAGAAGFRTEPTAASRGEPFVTGDGWTVRFEHFVVQARVGANHIATGPDATYAYGGGSEMFLWDLREPVTLDVPALSEGTWMVHVRPTGHFLGYEGFDEGVVDLGVEPRLAELFHRPADGGSEATLYGYDGPIAAFALRAEKAGRAKRLALALGASPYADPIVRIGGPEVVVSANRLASTPLRTAAENLLADELGRTAFQPFADADTDDDGLIAVRELFAVRVLCTQCFVPAGSGALPDRSATLFETLRVRVPTVLEVP